MCESVYACEVVRLSLILKEKTTTGPYPVCIWKPTLLCFFLSCGFVYLTLHRVLSFRRISVCRCLCVSECGAVCTLKKRRWGIFGRWGGTDGPCHICLHLVPSPYEPPNIRIRHESIFCCFFCTNACTYFAVLVPSGTDRRTVQQDTAGMDCCHGW